MTEILQQTGDVALGWVRRHLFTILSIAAAAGFARAELVNMREGLDEARRELTELHAAFVDFRLAGVGVSKDALTDALGRQRETDDRQDAAATRLQDRLAAIEAAARRSLEARLREAEAQIRRAEARAGAAGGAYREPRR